MAKDAPRCASCGEPAEWEAEVNATGPKGTATETVPMCDACLRRGLLRIAASASDAEIEMDDLAEAAQEPA